MIRALAAALLLSACGPALVSADTAVVVPDVPATLACVPYVDRYQAFFDIALVPGTQLFGHLDARVTGTAQGGVVVSYYAPDDVDLGVALGTVDVREDWTTYSMAGPAAPTGATIARVWAYVDCAGGRVGALELRNFTIEVTP